MAGLAYELGFPCCKPLKRNDEEEEENRENGETLRCSGLCTLSITSVLHGRLGRLGTHNNAVVNCKKSELVKSSNQVPACCDVTGYKD